MGIIWEVVTNGWYRNYQNRDDESEATLTEWLEYLKTNGVATSYATWREQHKTIVAALTEGKDLDTAIKAACVAPRLASIFESNNILTITAPDGDRQLPTGQTVKIEYNAEKSDVLNGETYGDYVEKMSTMPSSRHASETIRHDLKNINVNVTAFWEGDEAVGVEFRTFVGELTLEDSQGNTPYQIVVKAEKEIPPEVLKRFFRKFTQKFDHVALGGKK